MAKAVGAGTITTGSGTYQVSIGSTHGGQLTLRVVAAALHRAPGVVDSAMLSSKAHALAVTDEE